MQKIYGDKWKRRFFGNFQFQKFRYSIKTHTKVFAGCCTTPHTPVGALSESLPTFTAFPLGKPFFFVKKSSFESAARSPMRRMRACEFSVFCHKTKETHKLCVPKWLVLVVFYSHKENCRRQYHLRSKYHYEVIPLAHRRIKLPSIQRDARHTFTEWVQNPKRHAYKGGKRNRPARYRPHKHNRRFCRHSLSCLLSAASVLRGFDNTYRSSSPRRR